MLCILAVFAVLASAQGRAVNISNTWVLPEEGFPVFYRYFRDRISWYEADAVCQFHHANLVTVDTTAQYDAVRAYLKELDISSAVWVGLIRSNPDGDFTWTDYRGLSGDGYWSSAPDTSSAPLCAAANPSADYRWEARACGGPTVASFICELPVPQWALGNEGCMVRALPALTILYLPESAAVQLTADCGLAGVKRVQCTGNVKREELLKNLACVEEEETTTALNFNSSETNPATSDSTVTDQETTTELTTEGIITTEHEVDVNQPIIIPTTHQEPYLIKYKPNLSNNVLMHKKIDLGDNNAQSNHIPKIADVENVLTNDQLEKLEDERHMQHKMLHEEIARVGNVDNIFTQPTDHFIPPLVMAKAKISDDMTVLSLAEKHAQQLAERHFSKQNFENHSYLDEHSVTSETNADKTLITPIKSDKIKQLKKESYKNNPPKKYVNDKYYDAKNKVSKANDLKVIEKTTEVITSTESVTTKEYSTSTNSPPQIDLKENTKTDNDDDNMELTVILKETSINGEQKTTFTNYSGDVAKLDTIINATSTNPIPDTNQNSDNKETDKIMDHDVIKITIIADDDPSLNVTVFEVTTKMPIFKDDVINTTFTSTAIPPVTFYEENHSTEAISKQETTTYLPTEITHTKYENTTTPVTDVSTEVTTKLATKHTPIVSTTQESLSTTVIQTSPTASIQAIAEDTNDTINILNATSIVITDLSDNYNHNESVTSISIDKIDFNNTEIHDDIDKNVTSSDAEEFQSPLLSAANEPLHRPPRTRRPQQPNRNKFNPFRILG